MKLYIVRHGEAEPTASSDAERELTERGRIAVAALWQRLAEEGVQPLSIVSSPYRRAQQTAALIAGCYPGVPTQNCDLITPDESPREVIEWLAQQGSLDGWVLVSHMPLVAALTGLLTEGLASRVPFAVGTVAYIDLDVPTMAGGRLIWQRNLDE